LRLASPKTKQTQQRTAIGNFLAGQRVREIVTEAVKQVVSEVNDRIRTVGLVSLFLDFDGTLAPIEADPAAPRLDPGATETLRTLSNRDFLVITIISGRAVEDLYTRIRLNGLIYAGNYGLEIFGRDLRFVEPCASARRKQLEWLCDELQTDLRAISGTIVEFKGLTAAIHYRQADKSDYPAIEAAVRAAVARAGNLFRLNPGRKVLEIMPRTGWHKGTAVRWINNRLGAEERSSIYLGDDSSDEDAFCVLPDAITVRVGAARATCATHALPDPAAVHEFLAWLAAQERERANKG
jgi:trehalose-phosphatase